MKAAGLFSGGKESVFAIQTAQKQGIQVEHLIYEIPSFASPHAVNAESVGTLAKAMNKPLTFLKLDEEGKALVSALKDLKIEALVAGDINVEQHIKWLTERCNSAGNIMLLEPLWKRNTLELFKEMFGKANSKFKATIIGVDTEKMDEKWLGFTLSNQTAEKFLSETRGVDPLGENGEFHTIVTQSPLYSRPFQIKFTEKVVQKNMSFLKVHLN
ncbi:MAG: diphthine--ammonia ligase [Candidatus Bathyarchaeota archaeon]|nr:diphthine--ammonia ligase [Candidatus Bathyarchaeota archaeon]